MKNYFNIVIILLYVLSGVSNAISISKGTTYKIIEPDLLVEIQKKAKQVDWQALQRSMKLTQEIAYLPIAQEDKSYYYTPTAALPFEVKDKNGKVLYPKGFEFNPLKYTTLPNQLIVLGSTRHLKMMSSLSPLVSSDDTLLVANIDTKVFIKKTGKRAFLLTKNAIKRLGVKQVPAIISQQGDRFLIQVFAPRGN
ncbi:hypothetical protein [Bathymodiolus thermophilus thioautotrophic gill symbiont]|uniref:Conjugal transfer protein TraW n=1 Tax=Bathymodiolus thermophilus thioautotrophic gill symbiont TaxID=2360 RepID=A0A1J5U9X4_9GAMM|nr:hypothetical protein [Bathymodiolus thermophilus thioautotrophic gill symbiont]OIR25638.1 hypothetical protein BGC33_13765 [Bathymodiolus thermophilus thioautotrophic gill symbiont]